jgi:hypothetical protein
MHTVLWISVLVVAVPIRAALDIMFFTQKTSALIYDIPRHPECLGDRQVAEEASDLPARSRFSEGRAKPLSIHIHAFLKHSTVISGDKNAKPYLSKNRKSEASEATCLSLHAIRTQPLIEVNVTES